MMLFVKAFRGDVELGEPEEMERISTAVSKIFSGVFRVESADATNIGRTEGREDDKWLPGIIFRLQKI